MTTSRRGSRPADGVGPFEVGRAEYFAARHLANHERRQQADTTVRILEANLAVQEERLASLRGAVEEEGLSRRERSQRARAVDRQARHVGDLRRDLHHHRRQRTVTHDDRLIEWAVENDGRRLPSPGQYLLARRSTKPFPQHPTA